MAPVVKRASVEDSGVGVVASEVMVRRSSLLPSARSKFPGEMVGSAVVPE